LDKSEKDTEGTGIHGGGMAGDCNLFFNDEDDQYAAEIEVMIAEPKSRGKGLSKESLLLLMSYAAAELNASKFVAKISVHNTTSLNLFQSLEYVQVGEINYFEEISMQLQLTPERKKTLADSTNYCVRINYDKIT